MLEAKHGLDEARNACGRIEVADIGFHRTDGAISAARRGLAKSLRQRRYLDGVSQRCSRAMRLDITDGIGRYSCSRMGLADDQGLAVHLRGGKARLQRAVIVDGRTDDDGVDRIAVCKRIFKTLEHDNADAAAWNGSGGIGIKRPAMPVRRQYSAFARHISMRTGNGDAARERNIAFACNEALRGDMHGNQRRGAGCLHCHGRTAQIELVSRARRQKSLSLATNSSNGLID